MAQWICELHRGYRIATPANGQEQAVFFDWISIRQLLIVVVILTHKNIVINDRDDKSALL